MKCKDKLKLGSWKVFKMYDWVIIGDLKTFVNKTSPNQTIPFLNQINQQKALTYFQQ